MSTDTRIDAGGPPGGVSYRREDFRFELPARLIAQAPPPERGESRLLVLTGDLPEHRRFQALPALLEAGDLLVVNDTRVIKARLAAHKDSGGRAEILLERIESERVALCQVRVSKPLKPGRTLRVGDRILEVIGREGQFYRLAFPEPVLELTERLGSVPLPPYIERPPTRDDESRYQTVFSSVPGAVAAPTAGLHFTHALLEAIRRRGVEIASITLHVGAATFQPVRTSDLAEHHMHREHYAIDAAVAARIGEVRRSGGRVVAVGTTVVRTLEAAAGEDGVRPGAGTTDLFITPGYEFRVVDALVTNFHLPESTLLMLVCAFGGYRRVMAAYREAVAEGYRFFSYGDAMFVERRH